ncbi:hypothetical protein ACJMK2_014187 [Sinanodonta woodiana]|uniref:Uncharacterized protein n=1 Tax=Sinanodonta woodiana TaxID=1069815 RepID=A0ABD3V0A4_SINWO
MFSRFIQRTVTDSAPVASTSQLHTQEVANPSQATSTSHHGYHELVYQAVGLAISAWVGNAGLGNTNLCKLINALIQSERPLTQSNLVSASTPIAAGIPIKIKDLILERRYIDLALLLPDRSEENFTIQIDINNASPDIRLVPSQKKTPLSLNQWLLA